MWCNCLLNFFINMGNQLLKGYTMQGEPVSCVGCEKMWRIYQGIKKSTNQNVTIFAIQKRALNKSQRQDLIKFAKREAMGLARIRHPGVLSITETLIEDQNILAFSTEPILGNLSMLSKQNKLSEIVSNEIQLRLNLFPLLDTLLFLHDNVKTVHLSINFDNIYITKQGKWKIAGFSNSQIYSADGLQELDNGYRCGDFSYCAPEIVMNKVFQKRSDVYSLGVLILNLLQVLCGRFNDAPISSQSDYEERNEKELIKKINNSDIEKMQNYKELKLLLKNVLMKNADSRISLYQLINSKWLNDKLVLAVRYLQNITNYDSKQQIQFLKGLMGILNHFSNKILSRKIIPGLMQLLKFKHLIPSVIYISIQILKNGQIMKNSQFIEYIWPNIKKVLQGKQITANSLYLIVDNIPLIEKIVSLDQLTQTIMPLYIKCFDCPPKLKILALYKTDYILSKMDYQFIKAKFLPKVMACMKDPNQEVHKKSLIALKKCIKIIDVQTITSQVLGGLQNSRKAGTDPFINAISVSIYSQLAKTLPTQVLSSKLIPTILPYLTDPSVSAHDFYNYKTTMLTMLEKIEQQRKKYWDQNRNDANKYNYSEKDFEFQEQPRSTENLSSPQGKIGNGNYQFLNNYNKQQRKQSDGFNRRQANLEPAHHEQEQHYNFNQRRSNPQVRQYQNIERGPQSNNNMGNFSYQESDPWSSFSSDKNKNMAISQPQTNNDYGNRGMNQQFQQQSPNYPKLKGPQTGVRKAPQVAQVAQQKFELHDSADPWAALDDLSSEIQANSAKINYNMGNTGINMGYQNSSNQYQGINSGGMKKQDPWVFAEQKNTKPDYNYNLGFTSNNNSSVRNPYNINTNSVNMNYDNDPFSELSSGNNTKSNMYSNSNMGINFGNQAQTYDKINVNMQTSNIGFFGGSNTNLYGNNQSNNTIKKENNNFDFDLI